MRFFPLTLAFCLLAAGTARAEPPAFDLVYQIKTATDAGAPKAAYGSCFVVREDGLLATNYHVVAFALHEPEKYNLYLMDGEKVLPASVVAFDVVNDLALVHVDRTFPRAAKLAATQPDAGDKIYSIGWPEDLNKSVIEGNFNGQMTAGPYEKLQMSIPLNPGMSGGPTIDEAGDVIGVNVSIRVDSQNLAFAVPKALLVKLMKKPEASFSRPVDEPAFDEEVRDQLDIVQEALTSQLVKAKTETVAMGGWLAEKPARMLKCWREQESAPRDLTTATTEHCYLPGAAPVRRDVDTGTVNVKYQALSGSKLNEWQFVHHLNESLGNWGFGMADYIERFTTRFKCGEMDLVNAHKVPMRVHYCVNSYVRYAELYNLELEAVTLTPGRESFLVAASLLGFSSRNASEITRMLVNSVRPEPP